MSSIPVATLGTPRIGPRRELKSALEAHWAGRLDAAGLQEVAGASAPPTGPARFRAA